MNLDRCKKYADYLAQQCNDLQRRTVTDDALQSFSIELEKFRTSCATSDLPEDVKSRVAALALPYSPASIQRGALFYFASIITFGYWAGLLHLRRQARRKEALQEVYSQVTSLSMCLKRRS